MSSEKFGFILMAIVFGGGALFAVVVSIAFLIHRGILFGIGG